MKSLKISNLIAAALVLSLLTALAPCASAAVLDERVMAASAVLGEVSTGQLLYSQDADAIRGPDALTKFMLLLLAAEASERETGAVTKDKRITVSASALENLPSKADKTGLSAGETLTFGDLLMCAFIGGGADASNAVAEAVSGSVEEFVEQMNLRAQELGCFDTVFYDTHGQGTQSQQTTAYELFLIAREAAQHDLFLDVAGTVRYAVPPTNFAGERVLNTANYALTAARQKYYSRWVLAGRTSATYENGYGSVEIAQKGDMCVVSVILGAEAVIDTDQSTTMQNLTEAKRLIEWGFNNYAFRTLLSAEPVTRVAVKYGSGTDFVNLRPEREVSLLLSTDVTDSEIDREVTLYPEQSGETLTAPVIAGTELGEILLSLNGRELARVKLVADTTVDMLRIAYVREQIGSALSGTWIVVLIIVVIFLMLAYVALVIRYRILRKRRKAALERRRRELAEQRRAGGNNYE